MGERDSEKMSDWVVWFEGKPLDLHGEPGASLQMCRIANLRRINRQLGCMGPNGFTDTLGAKHPVRCLCDGCHLDRLLTTCMDSSGVKACVNDRRRYFCAEVKLEIRYNTAEDATNTGSPESGKKDEVRR